jgi:hypothetical protein
MADDTSKYAHMMMWALMGKTAAHLRDVHGVEPHGDLPAPSDPDDRRANAAAHLEAHGIPLNARWSWRTYRFVAPPSQ